MSKQTPAREASGSWQNAHQMRKNWKAAARKNLKGHYWLILVLCLIAAVTGAGYTTSLDFLSLKKSDITGNIEDDGSTTDVYGIQGLYDAVLNEQWDAWKEKSLDYSKTLAEKQTNFGRLNIGHSRGVLATMVNATSSGSLYLTMIATLSGIFKSENMGTTVFIILSFLFTMSIWVFFTNVYQVIYRRMILEGRTYKVEHFSRFLYLFRIRRWVKVAKAMLRVTLYEMLWDLTIIGGCIKHYSYQMVPYILAENPDISSKDAILLSRRMMDGHKWEAFLLDMSMLGWDILAGMTFGISALFYSSPYKMTLLAEYYVHMRQTAQKENIENANLLNDSWLYNKADPKLLQEVYSDIVNLDDHTEPVLYQGKPIRHFLAEFFGLVLVHDEEEQRYFDHVRRHAQYLIKKSVVEGNSYPARLHVIHENEKRVKVAGLGYLRCYSLLNLILMFFILSIGGWVWEVSQHLITHHEYVKRGVLHGYWLPIYGTGGLIMLLLLKKFRKKPALIFLGSVTLAGILEYFTAYYLEITHDGQKWWDYTGYFLNVDGRICAEGLLVFGLGGLAITYLAGPGLDNLLRRISRKILIPICAALVIIFAVDEWYSSSHPNVGPGITDIEGRCTPDTIDTELQICCDPASGIGIVLSDSEFGELQPADRVL